MAMDIGFTVDGVVTGVSVILGGFATFITLRNDVGIIKKEIGHISIKMDDISTTLARHDERLKHLEFRQEERLTRERQ